ncbi:MAG: glycosyltransferase [Methyloprofundus sp.]|nr:glycosyltransferase [Methyloprofundus sp.]
MRNLRTEDEIIANWKGDIDKPVVSICCITYNHEPYIEDALEGFLIQETDFPFEILIHDDASTDRTADIIREYEAKYPRLIKPIYQTENQYSQGKRATVILLPNAQGEFIALCEGDDYWTDTKKLQIQAEFLLRNPEVVITGHDAFIVDENGGHIKDSKLPNPQKRDFTGEDLILGKAWILTMSWMFRNVDLGNVPERGMVKNGDNFFVSYLGRFGGSHYHDDIKPAGYRVHSGGVWSMLSDLDKKDSQLNTWFWMYRYYQRIGEGKYARHYWMKYLRALFFRASLKDLSKEYAIRVLFLREQKALLKKALVKIGVIK